MPTSTLISEEIEVSDGAPIPDGIQTVMVWLTVGVFCQPVMPAVMWR